MVYPLIEVILETGLGDGIATNLQAFTTFVVILFFSVVPACTPSSSRLKTHYFHVGRFPLVFAFFFLSQRTVL